MSSFIRPHTSREVVFPPSPPPLLGTNAAGRPLSATAFLDEWAMKHFSVSVKMHDVARISEQDPERKLVLEDLGFVQGVLLEVHDYALAEGRVRAMMDRGQLLQNGVSALYSWLEDTLDAAARFRLTRGKPGFIDTPNDEMLAAILRALERVHPDLETLMGLHLIGVDEDIARKIALCFRQIGATVVRVSGRPLSSYPPQDR